MFVQVSVYGWVTENTTGSYLFFRQFFETYNVRYIRKMKIIRAFIWEYFPPNHISTASSFFINYDSAQKKNMTKDYQEAEKVTYLAGHPPGVKVVDIL